jgi:hypothetical protein
MAEDRPKSTEKQGMEGNKKPYAKPSVISEPIYETLALACGKLPGQGAACSQAVRRS